MIDQFLTYEMQADYLRHVGLLEVAPHCIPDLLVQIGQVICLTEDGGTQRPSRIPSLWCLFDDKNNFVHLFPRSVTSPVPSRCFLKGTGPKAVGHSAE